MSEPIRLWREGGFHEDGSPGWWDYNDMGGLPIPEAWTEYAALPRAEYDALVKERDEARGSARVCREDAEINAARAEKAEALLREARAYVNQRAASWRAVDAQELSDRIDALLGESLATEAAAVLADTDAFDRTRDAARKAVEAYDAKHPDAGATTLDDDRKGEDGEAVKAQGGDRG